MHIHYLCIARPKTWIIACLSLPLNEHWFRASVPRRQSWRSWGRDPRILGWGVVGSPWNIIISYNVQE